MVTASWLQRLLPPPPLLPAQLQQAPPLHRTLATSVRECNLGQPVCQSASLSVNQPVCELHKLWQVTANMPT